MSRVSGQGGQSAADQGTGRPESRDVQRAGLVSGSFQGLLATQFLGAANDNMFRWLAIGIRKDYVPRDQHALVLSAGLASFVLPYLLLAAPAGYLADRFSKRNVIVGCKVAEIAIMTLAVAAILSGNVYLLFGVLFLMGSQSALFGPAKFGSLPEMLPAEKISAANGVIGLTTVIATVVGGAAGNILYSFAGEKGLDHPGLIAAALVGTAAVGWFVSLAITRLTPANPLRTFPWGAARQTWRDLKKLAEHRAMLRVALGIAFFWSLGSLAQLNIDQFGFEGGLEQRQIVPLLIALVGGVGLGSVLAGVWSGGKVELGIIPLGAAGVAAGSLMLFTVDGSLINAADARTAAFTWACIWLFVLGLSAGLFDVPLAAYMQHRSPRESRGSILAANNFLTFLGILVSAGLFYALRAPLPDGRPLLTARQIFLAAGLFTLPVFVYAVWLLPQATVRCLVWLATHTLYRLRVKGRERLPEEGGALLIANHVSWVDGLLLLASSSREVRFVAYAPYANRPWVKPLARLMGVIPIHPRRPKELQAAFETARQALREGELVCVFPEGGISRTGDLQPFKPGLLQMIEGTGAPTIPVYLDGLWGSIFSCEGGRFLWKWPRKWPYPVSIHFGPPLPRLADVEQARRAVEAVGEQAVPAREGIDPVPPRAFICNCKRHKRQPKVADSTGLEMNSAQVLLRSLVLRRVLRREVLADDEHYVGLLLPPSGGAVLANAALSIDGRIPVNLNYTVKSEVLDYCNDQCGIRHVLTSRRVMRKLDLDLKAELVYLEDLLPKVRFSDKLAGLVGTYLIPAAALEKRLGLDKISPDDVLTVIFTSGSTGEPKGVMLTNRNISSNLNSIDQAVALADTDVLVGVLPFFHSLGYTATLWSVLTMVPKGVYHYSPLEAQEVSKLCGEHRATILMSTPTFLRSYIRRCKPEDFASLELVVAGAEKLPRELCDAFEAKFGVRPTEGYGTTELSPLVSVNVPESRSSGGYKQGAKEGSVGRPVPGVNAKVVDLDSGEDLGTGREGMLLVSGPNVMKGYLNRPEQTRKVLRDGWYVTGDIARIDEDGFIFITGRLSRFSKIGGEMVPHGTVEEVLGKILGEHDGELKAAVSSVPDARKGERLIVLHTGLDKSPDEICKQMSAQGLPNLFIPSPESFYQVDEIPVLGTGKLDLRRLKEKAEHVAGAQ